MKFDALDKLPYAESISGCRYGKNLYFATKITIASPSLLRTHKKPKKFEEKNAKTLVVANDFLITNSNRSFETRISSSES